MTEAKVVKELAAPAQQVFDILSVFDGVKPGGPISSVRYEGEGVGMIRYLGMGGGEVIERLDEHDPGNLTFAYSILNDDCPLPFAGYSARVQVSDNGNGTCTVDWTGTFEAQGDEQAAINTATGIYAGAIKGAKVALGI